MRSEQLATVLWDIPVSEQANLPVNFVVRRVLQYGGMSLLVSVLRTYGMDRIRSEFSVMQASAFEARRYHYLKHYFFASE
jgi:hypothetical protein